MSQMTDLLKKSEKDLAEELKNLKREQMNLRFQAAYGQLESPARVRQVCRQIARVRTLQRARQLEGEK